MLDLRRRRLIRFPEIHPLKNQAVTGEIFGNLELISGSLTAAFGQKRPVASNSSHGGVVLFEVEKKVQKLDPSTAHVSAALTKLRSYGPSSFASLSDEHGNYLQVAGGGLTFLLERRAAAGAQHFRAYVETPSGLHPDGTILAFTGGQVKLQANEWISAPLVIEAFTAFLQGHELPHTIRWRDITSLLGS